MKLTGIPLALRTRATASLFSASRPARVASSNRFMKPSQASSRLPYVVERVGSMKGLLRLAINSSEKVRFGRVPETRIDLQHANFDIRCMVHGGQVEVSTQAPRESPNTEGKEWYGSQQMYTLFVIRGVAGVGVLLYGQHPSRPFQRKRWPRSGIV